MAYAAPKSFTQFRYLLAKGAREPVRANLYSVDIRFPRVLGAGALQPNEFKPSAEYYDAINYFADSVTIPSRNITTGDTQNFGLQRSYATGQTPN